MAIFLGAREKTLSRAITRGLSMALACVTLSVALPTWANETRPKTTTPQKKTTTKAPSTVNAAKKDLATMDREIRAAQRSLRLTQAERAKKETELKKAEVQIGDIQSELNETTAELKQRQQTFNALITEKNQREADKNTLMAQLKLDVENSYKYGGEDYFKLFLNQEEPAGAARQLKYYSYIQQARSQRIHEVNHTLAELARLEAEEKVQLEKLTALQANLQKKQAALSSAQEQRNKALTVLKAQADTQDEKLKRLRRDQAALQSVMQRLEQQAREEARREAARQAELERQRKERERIAREEAIKAGKTPPKVDAPKPEPKKELSWGTEPDFDAKPYTGRCALPVQGGIRHAFGSERAGGLRWNGIMVAAPAGTPVKAVKAGKVVYADYLRGYGLLVIIDHGKGLMSLYGHNQSLLKKVGDQVSANESVALVGSSGGNDASALYFETRLRGRPSNPAAWCSY